MSGFSELTEVELGKRRTRRAISDAKGPFLKAVLDVLHERREFWPLSDRAVHYALLNDPPLRHASKPNSRYGNDKASYRDLTDLLTRARLTGDVPWNAIGDETRPVTHWCCDATPQEFLRRELDNFLKGYWRDYQQSQPNHVEIVAEKLTVRPIIEPVAQEYALPLTISRGYCSIVPRYEIARRFRRSGRERLIILLLSDFDPDGESIAESFARSMRDDFGIAEVQPIKVALTGEQVESLDLPPQMQAKPGASTYARFTARHGQNVFELEAVPPSELQFILRDAIESVLDMEAFRNERSVERVDAAFLETVRRRAHRALLEVTEKSYED